MQEITDRARAVLNDPSFVVPPVPAATTGIAWLRASVGRFSSGADHVRRRALAEAILDAVPPESLGPVPGEHPVTTLARAMGITAPVADLIRDVAQAYQPGTGDADRADRAVERLVGLLGSHDEATAARIGVLTQACDATAALAAHGLRAPEPPVRAVRRQATVDTTIGTQHIAAGEIIAVVLSSELAFGSGPRECPGRAHALRLAGC
jgi:hypothetical protein